MTKGSEGTEFWAKNRRKTTSPPTSVLLKKNNFSTTWKAKYHAENMSNEIRFIYEIKVSSNINHWY